MLVIDASVAVKFVVNEPDSVVAEELLDTVEPLIAPDWIIAEVANALSRKWNRGEIADALVAVQLRELPRFFTRLVPSAPYLDGAMRLAFALKHALYDCLYLQLAIGEGCPLVTADVRFHKSAIRGGLGHHIRLLGSGTR